MRKVKKMSKKRKRQLTMSGLNGEIQKTCRLIAAIGLKDEYYVCLKQLLKEYKKLMKKGQKSDPQQK